MIRIPGLPSSLYYGNLVNRDCPLNAGLVSWWLTLPQRGKDNTFFDIASRNHGTLTNGPTWQGALGRPGGLGALRFTAASSQYVNVPNFSLGTNSITVEAWVYTTNWAQSGIIVNKEPVNTHWLLFLDGTNINWRMTSDITYPVSGLSGWHYLAATRDVTSVEGRLYLDGVLVTGPTFVNFTDSVTTLSIGRYDSGFYFDGLLDHIKISNVAKSAAEIWQSYEDSRRGYPQTLNRVRPYSVFDVGGGGGGKPYYYYAQAG